MCDIPSKFQTLDWVLHAGGCRRSWLYLNRGGHLRGRVLRGLRGGEGEQLHVLPPSAAARCCSHLCCGQPLSMEKREHRAEEHCPSNPFRSPNGGVAFLPIAVRFISFAVSGLRFPGAETKSKVFETLDDDCDHRCLTSPCESKSSLSLSHFALRM